MSTVLTYLRRLGLLPRLTGDALSDSLVAQKTAQKRIDYRKPHELQKLLDAALAHDAATFTETREEHAGRCKRGSTKRYTPIAPLIVVALMTGRREGALLALDWSDVDFAGNVITASGGSHTKRTGSVDMAISPGLRALLVALHTAAGKPAEGRVFAAHTRESAKAALKRLVREYGAPRGSNWQALRRTCGTYLTCAPSIFGGASAYRSAKQLGHSVEVAERSYVGLISISPEARTLEAAMQIDAQIQRVIDAVTARTPD